MVQSDRPQMTIRCMLIVCWIPKSTNAPSEYVIIMNFPLEQWLHEHDCMLGYMHIASFVHIVSRGTLS